MIFTGMGPIVALTARASFRDPAVLEQLRARGIPRFIAYEVPVELARERYGAQFAAMVGDIHQTDDLRVLDADGDHAFGAFRLSELEPPILQERASS